jgi:hypothetical protein
MDQKTQSQAQPQSNAITTEPQLRAIHAIAQLHQLDARRVCEERFGTAKPHELSVRQASQ